jgi:hypothetical protein
MSFAGFEVYNDSGALQVRSDMYAYKLRKTGLVQTVPPTFGNTETSDVLVPRSGMSAQSVCAIQCFGYGVGFIGYQTGTSPAFCFVSNAPVGTVVRYFIFDRADAVPPSTFGVECYDDNGKVTFSSNFRVMNAVGLLSFGDPQSRSYFGDAQSLTLAGKSLAFMQGAPAGRAGPMGLKTCWIGGVAKPLGPPEGQTCDYYTYDNNGKIYGGLVSSDGTSVNTTSVSWDDVTVTDPEGDDTGWQIPLKLFVVDVTGVPIGTTFF